MRRQTRGDGSLVSLQIKRYPGFWGRLNSLNKPRHPPQAVLFYSRANNVKRSGFGGLIWKRLSFFCLKLEIQRVAQQDCSCFYLMAQLQEIGKFGSDALFTFQVDKGWESLKNCLNRNATEKVRKHRIIFPYIALEGGGVWWRRNCQYALDGLVGVFYFNNSSRWITQV